MNYIQQLKADVQANADLVMHLQQCIYDLKALMLSDKHQGVQSDGERNDWIASADVLRWCDNTLRVTE